MKIETVTTFLIASFLLISPALAQSFQRVEADITPVQFASMVMGDLDGDGSLDVIVSGDPADFLKQTRVYRNDPLNAFEEVPAGLPDIRFDALDLGDYDNDGDLDVLAMSSEVSDVYRNDGGFQFTPLGLDLPTRKTVSIGSEVVNSSSAVWGDYDNDGLLDILISGGIGTQNAVLPALIFRNNGGDDFPMLTDVGLDALDVGSVAWGDYDNDGDLDVLASNHSILVAEAYTRIYRNDGSRFNVLDARLPAVETGSAKWGDYDNDGLLDVLIAGRLTTGDGTADAVLFRNLGNNQGFTETSTSLPEAVYGDWIDFDHDGQRDVLLNRPSSTAGKTVSLNIDLFRNVDARGNFEPTSDHLNGIWWGAIATGDLNSDDAPDILAVGGIPNEQGNIQASRVFLYENTATSPNQRPLAPTNLQGSFNDNDLVLEWSASTDPDNPAAALTYNVRVGSAPGASDVLSAMSLSDGTRLLPAPGNAGHITRMVLRDVDPGQMYYWSVQAVDAGFAGSAFAPEIIASTSSVAVEEEGELPERVALLGNYPNPFNAGTMIQYALPEPTAVRLSVYTMLGQKVADLVDGVQPAGEHKTFWDGRDAQGHTVPSGLYLYRLETPEQTVSRRMVFLK